VKPTRKERLNWINRQRKLQREGSLTLDRFVKLNAAGFIFDVFDTSSYNKMKLIDIACNGGERPVRGTHPLGSVLHNYICETSETFDREFKVKLQGIVPHWFSGIKVVEIAKERKRTILVMAMGGQSKPTGLLADALRNYTNQNRGGYDQEFHISVRNYRPEWLWDNSSMVVLAERLASNNDGLIPMKKTLREMGYGRLVSRIEREPRLFVHLEIEKWEFDRESYLLRHFEKAREIAIKNNNMLPSNNKLIEMGCGSLVKAIVKNPERFSCFVRLRELGSRRNDSWMFVVPAGKTRRKKEEWIVLAEKIADANGGFLPGKKALIRNGLSGLVQRVRENPDCFGHIRRRKEA
jgi:hypothetical protein